LDCLESVVFIIANSGEKQPDLPDLQCDIASLDTPDE